METLMMMLLTIVDTAFKAGFNLHVVFLKRVSVEDMDGAPVCIFNT